MNWTAALSELPLWATTSLVVGLGTIFGMVGPLLVRRFFRLEQLKINNEVAGFTIAVIGAIYGVALGFAMIVVWEKFRDAESAVMKEASTISSLEQLVNTADQPSAELIRGKTLAYEHAVINEEWPAMRRGRASPVATNALNELYAAVLAQDRQGLRENSIFLTELAALNDLSQARSQRLTLATGVVPEVIWLVLAIGGIITVLFTFFFGAASLSAHVIMNGLLSALIFLTLFAILEISYPFSGAFQVTPEAIEALLHTAAH